MNENIKKHLFSAGITFVSTFLTAFSAAIVASTQGVEITVSSSFLVSIGVGAAISAVRAAGKALFEDLLKADVFLGVRR